MEFASNADFFLYIGKSQFELYESSGICTIGTVVFDDQINTFNIKDISLSKETTKEDIQSFFPFITTFNDINVYQDPNTYQVCSITLTLNGMKLDGDHLIFFFLNNQLVRIDFWEPT